MFDKRKIKCVGGENKYRMFIFYFFFLAKTKYISSNMMKMLVQIRVRSTSESHLYFQHMT